MKKLLLILPMLGIILGTTPAFAVTVIGGTQKIQVEVGRTEAERNAQIYGDLGYAVGSAIADLAQTQNITDTKMGALYSWVGGKKKICQPCYDNNLELKQRVELTTLRALQFQKVGYNRQDSIESAKTIILMDIGKCDIPKCEKAVIAQKKPKSSSIPRYRR